MWFCIRCYIVAGAEWELCGTYYSTDHRTFTGVSSRLYRLYSQTATVEYRQERNLLLLSCCECVSVFSLAFPCRERTGVFNSHVKTTLAI